MSNDDEVRQELLERIKARRASINAFVSELDQHSSRLTNLSIICSAVVTALTAGPAFGGEMFTTSVRDALDLAASSQVWQPICLFAVVLSIVAAIATNMARAHDLASRLAKAQMANAKLEGLEAAVEFGQVSVPEAVDLYQEYLTEIPFIQEKPVA